MNPARPSPIINPCTKPAAARPRPVLGSITLSRAARTRSLSGIAMRVPYPQRRPALQAGCRAPDARDVDHLAHMVQAFRDRVALLAHLVGGLEQVGHHYRHHPGGMGGTHAVM